MLKPGKFIHRSAIAIAALALVVAAWPNTPARALNFSSYCLQPNGSAACYATPSPGPATPSAYNMGAYYGNMNQSGTAAITCAGATPDPNGYLTSCLIGTLKFAETGISDNNAAYVNSVAAVVPYVGNYMDVINGCGNNPIQIYCLPNMNPEQTTGIAAMPTMPSNFFDKESNGRDMDTTSSDFTFNQSTSSFTGASCGSGAHTFTSTTYQNNCTLNPAVPLPAASPVTYQLDPTGANERYRANVESQSSVVSSVYNAEINQDNLNYLAAPNHLATAPYNYVFEDDSFNPGDSSGYPVFYEWGNTSFGNAGFSLAQLTGASYPYSNYNYANFISGLASVMASGTLPTMISMSGYQPDGPPGGVDGVALPAMESSALACGMNCLGIVQENPWDNAFQNQNQPTSNLNWASNANLWLYAIHNGKYIVGIGEAVNTPTGYTFTQAVTAGTHTVSVSGLVGVEVGSPITTSTNAETVTVTATTATTLTATFAHSHANGSGFAVDANQAGVDASGLYVRRYAWASEMLACGDNIALCVYEDYYQIDDANDSAGSGLALPIEAGLVPAGPLTTPPPVWNASAPTTTGVYGYEDTTEASGSTYACPGGDGPSTGANCVFWREFSQVYNRGSRVTNGSNHGVAVVIAPGNGGTYRFPALTQTYAHSLQISGFDYLQGTSTSGSLNVNGPACPTAGTLIHGQIAYICLP